MQLPNKEVAMAAHSSTLAGKSHGRRSLVGYSPWGHEESDTTDVTVSSSSSSSSKEVEWGKSVPIWEVPKPD